MMGAAALAFALFVGTNTVALSANSVDNGPAGADGKAMLAKDMIVHAF